MSNQHSNQVYVMSLSRKKEFKSIAELNEQNQYAAPAGKRFFNQQPDYLGFRYDGYLQRVSHVDKINFEYRDKKLFLVFILGPNLIPNEFKLRSGKIWHLRAWSDFDLLFSSDSVRDALIATKERHQF